MPTRKLKRSPSFCHKWPVIPNRDMDAAMFLGPKPTLPQGVVKPTLPSIMTFFLVPVVLPVIGIINSISSLGLMIFGCLMIVSCPVSLPDLNLQARAGRC